MASTQWKCAGPIKYLRCSKIKVLGIYLFILILVNERGLEQDFRSRMRSRWSLLEKGLLKFLLQYLLTSPLLCTIIILFDELESRVNFIAANTDWQKIIPNDRFGWSFLLLGGDGPGEGGASSTLASANLLRAHSISSSIVDYYIPCMYMGVHTW